MTYVIAAGGTAGHIYPALAVAEQLTFKGKDVVFAGSIGGMEEQMALDEGLAYYPFAAKGFDRQKPWTLISSSLLLARSTGDAKLWLRAVEANAVAAFGGYASVPVGRAAARLGIPLLIQEQNSHMGWTNSYLSKQAQVIALAYEDAAEGLAPAAKERVELTGNPVRKEFLALQNPEEAAKLRSHMRSQLGFTDDALVLLVFGGSQGARSINNAAISYAQQLMSLPRIAVLHLAGRKEAAEVSRALEDVLTPEEMKRWRVLDYCNEMPAAFAAADVVLSRAGASSLAELAVAGKPSLLVPFPYATADHQRKNAQSLVKLGAAAMLLDDELSTPIFIETLTALLTNEEQRTRMQTVAASLQNTNAAERIADLLISL